MFEVEDIKTLGELTFYCHWSGPFLLSCCSWRLRWEHVSNIQLAPGSEVDVKEEGRYDKDIKKISHLLIRKRSEFCIIKKHGIFPY